MRLSRELVGSGGIGVLLARDAQQERTKGGLDLRRAIERREEQQVLQLRPERTGPHADQGEVALSVRPELLDGLDLPLALSPRLLRQETLGMGWAPGGPVSVHNATEAQGVFYFLTLRRRWCA